MLNLFRGLVRRFMDVYGRVYPLDPKRIGGEIFTSVEKKLCANVSFLLLIRRTLRMEAVAAGQIIDAAEA